jgi:hypothetical protein
MNIPPGWYPQPDDPRVMRWWDGSRWTDQIQPISLPTPPLAQPNRKVGLAITAAALTVAGLIGLSLGFVGGLILVAAVVVALIALAKRQRLRGLSIASLCIAPIALVIALAVAIGSSSSTKAPVAAEPEPVVTADYKDLPERDLAVLVKDPGAHKGEKLVIFAKVTQFDTATGGCTFRANAAHARPESTFGYDHNSVFSGGSGGVPCDQLKSYVDKDEVKVLATVKGEYTYTARIGGPLAAPEFRVDQIERLAGPAG